MDRKRLLVGACAMVGLAVLVAFAGAAWSQVVPPPGPEVDPNAIGDTFASAISAQNWGLAIAAGVMIAVWILRKFVWKALNKKAMPYVAVALGVLAGFGGVMLDDPSAWGQGLANGAALGLMAAGEWGLLGVVRKK